jgi:hypothetical protein
MTNIFKYIFLWFRAKLSEKRAAKVRERKNTALVNDAIDHLIDGIDPNMRLVIGYKKKLAEAVNTALSYIDRLVDQIPGPVEFNKRAFGTDPQVNALFATVSDVQKTFSQNETLSTFFDDNMHVNVDASFALMCMEKKENAGFGMQLEGDLIKKDVSQVTVNFFGHNILSPAATEKEVRHSLKQCIFDALISNAFERVVATHMREGGSDEYRKVLDRRYKANQAWGQELTDLLLSIRADAITRNGKTQKESTGQDGTESSSSYIETPGDHLEQVKTILAHPETMIRLNHITMNLTRMGVKVDDDLDPSANKIELAELEINDVWRRIIVIVKYPRNEMLAKNNFFSNTNHAVSE